MEIAFIGHGYHEKTKSSAFFIDILKKENSVTTYFDYKFNNGAGVDIEGILNNDYDLIVVFQIEYVAQVIAERLPERLVFVPMFDGARFLPREFWASFLKSRILNFSWALHERLGQLGVPSVRVQYFPDPALFEPVADFTTLRGFFWQRRQEIGWPIIRRLCADQEFARFNLHLALDPDSGEPDIPDASDASKFNISISNWSEDRRDIDKILAQTNVYFAPRSCEGIGMSFLEAMARGQCVVAPSAPTMSAYITHRVSGLLYDADSLTSLDFSTAERIGANARRTIERGFTRWRRDQSDLLPALLFGKYADAFAMGDRAGRRLIQVSDGIGLTPLVADASKLYEGGSRIGRPRKQHTALVSIAIVVRNASAHFLRTLYSVLGQTYSAKEIVVIDGGSDDGTLDLIRSNSYVLDYWKSEPDEGPYDGMNKAAVIANGRYILFMNAGDEFTDPDVLAQAMEDAERSDSDFIIGHHIYVKESGVEELHKAREFEDTWKALTRELIPNNWLRGVPCHQATLTRTALLRRHRYDTTYRIAADLEFLCRQRAAGARVHNCDAVLAIYFAGGLSSKNETLSHREWIKIARRYGGRKNAHRLSEILSGKPRRLSAKWSLGIFSALRRRLGR